MRALAIIHESDAGAGVFAGAMRDRGVELDRWSLPDEPSPPGEPRDYDAVLTFGGAMHPDQESTHPWIAGEKELLADLLERGVPLLGVCLGAQLLAAAGGGSVGRASSPEIGWYHVEVTDAGSADPVLGALASGFEGLEWHSYEFGLPPGGTALARSERCLQAFRIGECAWGIQFHAEVTLSDFGSWLDSYGTDPDALRVNLDHAGFRAQTEARIEAWNELGRGLCSRFLTAAGDRAHARS
jgi:GMP synthase-like glutamine amidotransferase